MVGLMLGLIRGLMLLLIRGLMLAARAVLDLDLDLSLRLMVGLILSS